MTGRVNVHFHATYSNRLLASGDIVGVGQVEARQFLGTMLNETGVAIRFLDFPLREATPFRVEVIVSEYRTS